MCNRVVRTGATRATWLISHIPPPPKKDTAASFCALYSGVMLLLPGRDSRRCLFWHERKKGNVFVDDGRRDLMEPTSSSRASRLAFGGCLRRGYRSTQLQSLKLIPADATDFTSFAKSLASPSCTPSITRSLPMADSSISRACVRSLCHR